MKVEPLRIEGSWSFTPAIHGDDRGVFLESFRFEALEGAIGHRFELAQANSSVSKRGVLRGIHFADVPPGQAKYVMCATGAVLDYIIDIRVGSPTFGQWEAVQLDDVDRRAVYLAEGLGHAFIALTDEATVTYFVSSVYSPTAEHGINPLDPDVALAFPDEAGEPLLSPKDVAAPGLFEARDSGLLPDYEATLAFRASRANR